MDVPNLKPRDPDSHKGTHGRALVIGGSRGMTGAVCLTGLSTLRSGAGLVTLAVPDRCLETVAGFNPCYMTVPLEETDRLQELTEAATSVGIGPGTGQGEHVQPLVTQLYGSFSGPMVIDADALNALAAVPEILRQSAGPRILTPHIGEFRRLISEPNLSPTDCRNRAKSFAAQNQLVLVLKGNRTLVTDGSVQYENTTGNPGMAPGGSGDVLTGVITALLGQDYSPLDAAVLGVFIHGLAGDIARDQFGEISMTALHIANALPAAFQQHAQ